MIKITKRAKQELMKILTNKVDWPGARLRLMDRGQGKLGLGIDIEAPGDKVVKYEGEKLMLIEPVLAANLKEVTLDVDDTPEGVELVSNKVVIVDVKKGAIEKINFEIQSRRSNIVSRISKTKSGSRITNDIRNAGIKFYFYKYFKTIKNENFIFYLNFWGACKSFGSGKN